MEENKNLELEQIQQQEEKSTFDFKTIFTTVVLNWKWFVLSLAICLGAALIYLRYATPIYQAHAKILIKDEEQKNMRASRAMMSATNLAEMTNSAGIDNEMEVLKSRSLAEATVRDLKLYVNYRTKGKIKEVPIYKSQPVSVDLDPGHLEKLEAPIALEILRKGNAYQVKGSFMASSEEGVSAYKIDKTFTQLPATISTKAGILSFNTNGTRPMKDGEYLKVTVMSPQMISGKYVGSLSVAQTGKMTNIAQLVLTDEIPDRAVDYLKQLAVCYNRQANDDKNEVAIRTEEFINGRLEKINAELDDTENKLADYKRRNNMVELKMNAQQAVAGENAYSQKLADANTQVAIINDLTSYMNQASNKYQPMPANVGLTDQGTASLINKYNEVALERKRMLQSVSENHPSVAPLTDQLEELSNGIRGAMNQSRRAYEMQRNSVASQYGKYSGQISNTPEQEHMLTQIGRQQEVKSGLYLMLLQKREENSISLAATADKGRLIDQPQRGGMISPKRSIILGAAALLGLAIPALILFLLEFFRYKIEGHEDVAKLTKLPILADVAVASETAKTKADIVVHENKNNQMEEIFRSMRTNLQFMMKEGQKIVLFTSSTSGEGKTFNAANLSVSFALLGKKVVLVGLDIRKPRLAELFEINDHQHGITPLLVKENPTVEEVRSQILPSGINNNLDLLLAGPIPPNPTELIARNSLEKVMDILKANYDYIIIDSAPVGLVTDTLQIGRIADATVYMCRADYTPKESFNLINSLAIEKKLPNMSIVLNGIDMSKKKYGYYYGYGRYGKYGRYGRYGSKYSSYGSYGSYGNYSQSNYGDKNDTSVKR